MTDEVILGIRNFKRRITVVEKSFPEFFHGEDETERHEARS